MFKLGLSFFAVALGGRLLWRSRPQMTPGTNKSIKNSIIMELFMIIIRGEKRKPPLQIIGEDNTILCLRPLSITTDCKKCKGLYRVSQRKKTFKLSKICSVFGTTLKGFH